MEVTPAIRECANDRIIIGPFCDYRIQHTLLICFGANFLHDQVHTLNSRQSLIYTLAQPNSS